MQGMITAYFDSADEAERAAARLRRTIPYLRAEVRNLGRGSQPALAPYCASVYFPWRINMTVNDRGPMNTELGSRALFTSDRMGLPIYYEGEAQVLLTLDAPDADRARAMLINMGGNGIEVS